MIEWLTSSIWLYYYTFILQRNTESEKFDKNLQIDREFLILTRLHLASYL